MCWDCSRPAACTTTKDRFTPWPGSAPGEKAAREAAYARGESDEFVKPPAVVSSNSAPVRIQDGDTVVFMNFRADRARELTSAFVTPDFQGFKREALARLAAFVALTE